MSLSFKEALEFYVTARAFREDLPDGMWEELRNAVADIVATYGRKVSEWPEEAREEFAATIEEIFEEWGFAIPGALMS